MKLVLLPGMDGTGDLFTDFIDELGVAYQTQVIRYTNNIEQSLENLADFVESAVPQSDSYVLLSESFSGPIAFEVVRRKRTNVQAVIFVATFLQNPRPLLLRLRHVFPAWLLTDQEPPDWVCDSFLLGALVDPQMRLRFKKIVSGIPAQMIRQRLDIIAGLSQPDVQIDCPSLYLQASNDILVPQRSVTDFEKCCVCLTVEEIMGKHFVLQSSPAACAERVIRFIEEVL